MRIKSLFVIGLISAVVALSSCAHLTSGVGPFEIPVRPEPLTWEFHDVGDHCLSNSEAKNLLSNMTEDDGYIQKLIIVIEECNSTR